MNFSDEQTIDRGIYLVAGLIFGAVVGYLAHQPAPTPLESMGVVIDSRRTVHQASRELDRCLAVNDACLRLLMEIEVQASATGGGQ